MLAPHSSLKIFAFREPAYMRKNFDGLAAIVETHAQEPLSGSLFLFRNRRGDRLKILYWDEDVFALCYKRLEQGTFQLPDANQDRIQLSSSERALILDGVDLEESTGSSRELRAPSASRSDALCRRR